MTDQPGEVISPKEHLARNRLEFVATLILAVGVVLTAWTAFQSTKWSGVQADSYAGAGAARTESTRNSTRAGQLTVIDVITFTQWLSAVNAEVVADPSSAPQTTYTPDPKKLSGILFERFRDEFRPAVEAWIATRPLTNPDAPPTPFAMPEYSLALQKTADEELALAERRTEAAQRANERSDNYVLTAVLFAAALFFAGVSSKFDSLRARTITVGIAIAVLIGGLGVLATFPVSI